MRAAGRLQQIPDEVLAGDLEILQADRIQEIYRRLLVSQVLPDLKVSRYISSALLRSRDNRIPSWALVVSKEEREEEEIDYKFTLESLRLIWAIRMISRSKLYQFIDGLGAKGERELGEALEQYIAGEIAKLEGENVPAVETSQ